MVADTPTPRPPAPDPGRPRRRIALVTGGARGIGLATCRRLLADGLRVAVADIDPPAVRRACTELDPKGASTLPVEVDVADTDSVQTMVDRVVGELGGIDVLVNNAGITDQGPSSEVSDAAWQRLVGIHLGGTFRCSRAAFPALVASTSAATVNMGSVAARVGLPGRLSYCAAKAGVEGVTRTLAVEWAHHGIRVNAVAPGWTRTRLVDDTIRKGLLDEARFTGVVPLGRLGRPDEIAAAVAFLVSEDAAYITGHTLVVDGGITVKVDL